MSKSVTVSTNDVSDAVKLSARGNETALQCSATSWDAGTQAALERSVNGVRWVPATDESDTAIVFTSTSRKSYVLIGRGFARLNVSGIGSTTGLTLDVE